jgi:hypothetical protein
MTLFTKGNKAAANVSKKAVAEMIRKRLEKDGDSLTNEEFTDLTSSYNALRAKRKRRYRKKPEAKKVIRSDADRLTGKEAEMHRLILQIEAERLETGRREWQAKQNERNGNTA